MKTIEQTPYENNRNQGSQGNPEAWAWGPDVQAYSGHPLSPMREAWAWGPTTNAKRPIRVGTEAWANSAYARSTLENLKNIGNIVS